MSILSNRKPASKPRRKPARFIRLAEPFGPDGKNALAIIRIGHNEEAYRLSRVPSDYGRGFLLEKQGAGAEESTYHVNLNGQQSTCECRGFLGYKHCKHLEGLAALDKAGKLTAPGFPLCPWCKDRPEKCGCNAGQEGDYAGYPDDDPITEAELADMADYYGE
jgi:hypothetical protein